MRVLHTALAVTAAAALVGGSGAALASAAEPGHTRTTAGAAACRPGTLKVSTTDRGTSQAGMNHAGTYLRVRNSGKSTCAISGYPGLALEGKGHTALKTRARHGDTYFAKNPGSHRLTLKPGASAYADLVWTHTGAGTAHAAYLQVSPTGGNSHSTLPFQQDVDNGTLAVTAWSTKAPTAS